MSSRSRTISHRVLGSSAHRRGALVESACVESENYEAMRGVVELLGLAEMPNVNYLKAAKKVVGID